jgi:ABC-type lipoprotein export system ATPase subunit
MIKLEGVSKSYGSIKVLENFTFDAEAGSAVCIIGRSGCGKSTLLKLVALIARPDRGSITIEGRNVTGLNEAELEELRRETIAYSFQEPLLIPYMTALENLTEVIEVQSEKAVEVLSQLGLSNRLNHQPSKLSVGEKKRVDIARAVLKKSTLLVVDEPLSSLDPSASLKVMELLREHAQTGGIVVYSSVEPSDARFADRVINM